MVLHSCMVVAVVSMATLHSCFIQHACWSHGQGHYALVPVDVALVL